MPELIDRRISFNAGEFSPWTDPRIDLEKYHSAARTLLNMEILPYGGVFRRPGTVLFGAIHDQTETARLVPFVSGDGTAYVLEFGHQCLRIWTTGDAPALVMDGASPLLIDTPYEAGELRALSFSQLNDILFIAHVNHSPKNLAYYSATSWRLFPFSPDYPALLPINETDIKLTIPLSSPPSGSAWSSSTTYAAGDQVEYTTGGVTYTFASRFGSNKNNPPGSSFNRLIPLGGGYRWLTKTVKEQWWQNLGPSASLGSSADYAIGKRITLTASNPLFSSNMVDQTWALQYPQDILTQSLPINTTAAGGVSPDLFVSGAWSAQLTATTSGSGTWETRLLVQRSYDQLNWDTIAELQANNSDIQQLTTGSESFPCFIRLKLAAKSGTIPTDFTGRLDTTTPARIGLVRIIDYLTTTTVRAIVEFPLPSGAGATLDWYEGAWGGKNGQPTCVSIHQGRLFFAGTKTSPTTVWGSRVDRFGDFRIDTEADAAVSYQLASDNTGRIRWMISSNDLIIGTANSEWAIGVKGSESIIRAYRHSNIGTTRVQPVLVDDSVLFIQKSRRKLREMAWSGQLGRYASVDLTILAEHVGDSMFNGISVQRNPNTNVYIVLSNGKAAVMNYDRSQNITGWSIYDTGSDEFESIAAVVTGSESDELWAVVKRTIDGNTARYVERFKTENLANLKTVDTMQDALVYVDAAVQATVHASGNKIVGVFSSLDYLEGRTVSIVKEGEHLGNFPVSGGEIDVSSIGPVSIGLVTVGLPYDSIVEPTYLERDDPRLPTKAGKKRLHRAVIELYKSRGIKVTTLGPFQFTNLDVGASLAPTELFSGLVEHYVQGRTSRQESLRMKQETPYPFNLLSITMRYNVEID
jgi:hypothetical protein